MCFCLHHWAQNCWASELLIPEVRLLPQTRTTWRFLRFTWLKKKGLNESGSAGVEIEGTVEEDAWFPGGNGRSCRRPEHQHVPVASCHLARLQPVHVRLLRARLLRPGERLFCVPASPQLPAPLKRIVRLGFRSMTRMQRCGWWGHVGSHDGSFSLPALQFSACLCCRWATEFPACFARSSRWGLRWQVGTRVGISSVGLKVWLVGCETGVLRTVSLCSYLTFQIDLWHMACFFGFVYVQSLKIMSQNLGKPPYFESACPMNEILTNRVFFFPPVSRSWPP